MPICLKEKNVNPDASESLSNAGLFVAIEAGGTKFVVSVGRHWSNAVTSTFETTSPAATGEAVLEFIRRESADRDIAAIGVASFGPVGIAAQLPNYGVIGSTPKVGWTGFSYLDLLETFSAPIMVETDVNAAALAEARHGAGKGLRRVMYVTIGTGIGGGLVVDGAISNGVTHPELGHMLVPRHREEIADAGFCPFHGDCLEGLAAGPTVTARWGQDLSQLGEDHLAFRLQAYYLAAMCTNLILQSVPDRIVLGGGVMQTPGLLAAVRAETSRLLNGYRCDLLSEHDWQQLICLPQHAPAAGLVGAYELAFDCAAGAREVVVE